MSLKTLSVNWSKTQCLLVVVGPLTELAAPSSALWARHVWLYNSAPVGFVLQLRPRLPWLLYTIIHAGDELEGNPFKYGEQYPREKKKKSFSFGSGQGRGRCHPPVAVEAESNTENSILWRHPEEERVGVGVDLSLWGWGAE